MIRGASLYLIGVAVTAASAQTLPTEPVNFGHEPQFVFDLYIVDNHWGLRVGKETFKRVFHQPTKMFPAAPMEGFKDTPSWLSILRDEETGLLRMWYQTNWKKPQEVRQAEIEAKWVKEDAARIERGLKPLPREGRREGVGHFESAIAYAESKDGLHWDMPDLDLCDWPIEPNNVIIRDGGGPQIVEGVPAKDMRGYKHLMLYQHGGIHLIGSKDGIHWDIDNKFTVAPRLYSDHPNNVHFDPRRGDYVMYCRPKHIYRGGTPDGVAARRVVRMHSKELWTDWMAQMHPQTLIDRIDPTDEGFNFDYALTVRCYAGIYWGFLNGFRYNDYLWTDLVVSRNSYDFEPMPGRPKFIEYGPEGSWDSMMLLASSTWVEMDDEWWFYYCGYNNPHGRSPETGSIERDGGLGLATIKKERLISMRGPARGGMIVTRILVWPGGALRINADAHEGEIKVRVSDAMRIPIEGYDLDDCDVFTGDSVGHRVTWGDRSLASLEGQVIRLEFFVRDADLYTFRAGKGN